MNDNTQKDSESNMAVSLEDMEGVPPDQQSLEKKDLSIQSLSSLEDLDTSSCDSSKKHSDCQSHCTVPPIQIPGGSGTEFKRAGSLTGGVQLSVSPSSPDGDCNRPNPGVLACRRCSTPAGGRRTVCLLDCRYCRYVSEGLLSPSLMSPRASLFNSSVRLNQKSSPLLSPASGSPNQSRFIISYFIA